MADAVPRKKPGPKPKQIDLELLKTLPEWAVTKGNIAIHLGVCIDTLTEREKQSPELSAAIKAAISSQRSRNEQCRNKTLWADCIDPDPDVRFRAGVWWDKSRLGFSDRVTNINEGETIQFVLNRGTMPTESADEDAS